MVLYHVSPLIQQTELRGELLDPACHLMWVVLRRTCKCQTRDAPPSQPCRHLTSSPCSPAAWLPLLP